MKQRFLSTMIAVSMAMGMPITAYANEEDKSENLDTQLEVVNLEQTIEAENPTPVEDGGDEVIPSQPTGAETEVKTPVVEEPPVVDEKPVVEETPNEEATEEDVALINEDENIDTTEEETPKKAKAKAAINVSVPMLNGFTVTTSPESISADASGKVLEDTPYTATLSGHWSATQLFEGAYQEYLKNESFAGPRVMYNEKATKALAPLIRYTVSLPAGDDAIITGANGTENCATITQIVPAISADKKSVTFTISLPWYDYQNFFGAYLKDKANGGALDLTIDVSGTAKKGSDSTVNFTNTGYGSFWYYKSFMGINLDQEVMHFSDGDGGASKPILTLAKAPATSAKATYKVVNGTWEDGTSDDIVEDVTLTDGKGTITLPTGMKPKDGFYGGEWSLDTTEITEDTVYTYTFKEITTQDVSATSNLDCAVLINDDTNYAMTYIVNAKNTPLTFAGTLNMKQVKDQMKEIEDQYANGNDPASITLEDVKTEFTATLTIPDALDFVETPSATLNGAKGKFEITNTEVKGRTVTVTMNPVGNINTYNDLKAIVDGCEDELKVVLSAAKANNNMEYNTEYVVTGNFTGVLNAKANITAQGKIINFNLAWSGVQANQKTRATTDLTRRLKYTQVSLTGKSSLEGDIKVGDDTQHTSVYTINAKNKTISYTGSLNIKPVKDQMAAIEKKYGTNVAAKDISLSGIKTEFVAKLTLPKEIDFVGTPSATLSGDNGSFKVTNTELSADRKTVTVTMGLDGDIKTFEELKTALNKAKDTLEVTLSPAKANDSMQYDTEYTAKGEFTGKLTAKAENTTTGTILNINLDWNTTQSAAGADSTQANDLNNISFTHKYVQQSTTIQASSELEGDIKVGSETQHNDVYTLHAKNKEVQFTGALDIAPVKAQMKAIEAQYGANVANTDIDLKDLNTEFVAKLTLPDAMDFDGTPSATLSGDNGSFKVTNTELSADRKTVTVTMGLDGDIRTFEELKTALNKAKDTLEVTLSPAQANDSMKYDTNYTVVGEFTGKLTAKAENTKTGSIMNINLDWIAKQNQDGADSTRVDNLDNISFTLQYQQSVMDLEASSKLEGDIKVGDNTQHTDVYVVPSKEDEVKFTGVLDIKPVKEQMSVIEQRYGANVEDADIQLNELKTEYKATITLPDALDFVGTPSATLNGANGKFKVTNVVLSSDKKSVTITMKPVGEIKTFADLKKVLQGANDQLEVTLSAAKANSSMKYDTNYTAMGVFSGMLSAKAENKNTGSLLNISLTWSATQMAEGADSTNTDLSTISFTLKYKKSDTPANPDQPSKEKKPQKPGKVTTGAQNNRMTYGFVMVSTVLVAAILMVFRRRESK